MSGLTQGGRGSIDQRSLRSSPLTIDPDSNTLALGDLRWSAVVAALKAVTENEQLVSTPAVPAPDPPAEEATAESIAAWAKPGIARIVSEKRRLTKAQFTEAVETRFGLDTRAQTIDEAWAIAAPPDWRKQGIGNPKEKVRVANWRTYFPVTESK